MKEFLVSYGYGAGWSTWSDTKYKEFLLFDKTLIQMCKDKKSVDEVKKYLESKGYENIYMGGWKDCVVETLDDNEQFIIDEYDGSESVIIKDEIEWI